MSAYWLWFNDNWFPFLQSVGIVGSLLLTAAALRRDSRSRKAGDLLKILEQHRELWGDIHRRPELGRILKTEIDLIGQPISMAESEFVNLVLVHYQIGWMLARSGSGESLRAIAADAKGFISLPVPKSVWQDTKARRDGEFVCFVEKALAHPK